MTRAFLHYQDLCHPIPEGDLIRVGSSQECEIRLTDDPFISRRHCSLSLIGDELTVVDLHSSHGTHVNTAGVGQKPVPLHDGDTLRIGNTTLTVRLQ